MSLAHRCAASALISILFISALAAADPPSNQGTPPKELQQLLHWAVADGGLRESKQKDGTTLLHVADVKKLQHTLAAHRRALTAELRESLATFLVGGPKANWPALEMLLEVLGNEVHDSAALGYAALFRASRAADQLHYAEAVRGFEQGSDYFAQGRRADLQGLCLMNAGTVFHERGQWNKAQGYYERALDTCKQFPEAKSRIGRAMMLSNLGSVRAARGDLVGALDYDERAQAIKRLLYPSNRYPNGHVDLAAGLSNLGHVLQERGDLDRAQSHFEQALAMLRGLTPGPRRDDGLMQTINNLGTLLQQRGELVQAQSYLEQGLAMARRRYPRSDFPRGHPTLVLALGNLASVLEVRGEMAQAQVRYEQALAMCRRLYPETDYPAGHPQLASRLDNIGTFLEKRGEFAEAQAYLEQALAMRRRLHPRARFLRGHPDLVRALNNLGHLLMERGKLQQAQSYFEQALAMGREVYPEQVFPQGHPHLARMLNNMAGVLQRRHQLRAALHYLELAIQASRLTAAPLPPELTAAAAPLLLPIPHTVMLLQRRADYMDHLLSNSASVRDLQACAGAYALAATLQERIRNTILQREESKLLLQANVWDPLARRIGILARLQVAERNPERLRQAFAALEQSRARVFLESLGRANAMHLAGLSGPLQAEDQRLRQQLRTANADLQFLLQKPADQDTASLQQKLWRKSQEAEAALAAFERRLATTQPRYAALRFPQPASLAEARAGLGHDEVALLFTLGEDAAYALVVEGRPAPNDRLAGLAIVPLPPGRLIREKVEALVQRERLERSTATRELGAELYQLLLGPLAGRLRGKSLVIVPDGVLGYLPFELLVEGGPDGPFLLEQHRIRYAPSLTALHLIRLWQQKRPQPSQPLYAFGDPDYGSQQLAATREIRWREGGVGTFPRLVHSGEEVRAIGRLLGAAAGTVLTGRQASEATVKKLSAEGKLSQARYLHFATHGILGFARGQQPALVLSQRDTTAQADAQGRDDGLLTLAEVSALKLNADLVVLSACRSGRGQLHRGEGVSGLARAFLYAGSRGVVCSLWSVDDAATSTLMQALYRQLQQGVPAAEALRQAKLQLLHDDQPPVLWAPFVLLGR